MWSIPAFKALFAEDGPLAWAVFKFPIPGVTGVVETAEGAVVTQTWDFTPLNATGTAIFLAVIVAFFSMPKLTARDLWHELGETIKALWQAIVLIVLILVLANIANYSGGSATIGAALAAVGPLFPLFAPIIGWFGVFITGSVVNNNTLFAQLQVTTAKHIGVSPTLLHRGEHGGRCDRQGHLTAVDRHRGGRCRAVRPRIGDPACGDRLQPRDARLHLPVDVRARSAAARLSRGHAPAARLGRCSTVGGVVGHVVLEVARRSLVALRIGARRGSRPPRARPSRRGSATGGGAIMLMRLRRLSIDGTSNHGASGMSVCTNIVSFARE